MLKLVFITAAVVTVYGAGELQILHSPDAVRFSGHDTLDQSMMKEVLSAAMGFTISKGSDWLGISILQPFGFAEASVVVVVEGVSSLGLREGQLYPLNTDEEEAFTWQSLKDRVQRRYVGQNATLLRLELGDKQMLGGGESNWSVEFLDPSVAEDKQFLDEMDALNSLAKQVASGDGVSDVIWCVSTSLHRMVDRHGHDSDAVKEAKKLLADTLHLLTAAFKEAYNGRVVVAAMCSDVSHIRRTRSLLQASAQEEDAPLNLAPEYSPDYPVIFNIMLWFGVAFVFSLLAISLFIADMDPGRDSIIYRMTSTRMKKDN